MHFLNQLKSLINTLPSGTRFSITVEWLASNGIIISASQVKKLGLDFAGCYDSCNCKLVGKGSNNLKEYEKI